MTQKPIRCCSETSSYLVTYSVSGSEKEYLVCSSYIKKECFSKYILRQHSIENKIKKFQNEQSELIDESSTVSEIHGEQTFQNEHNNEHGGFIL
ncbi:MAG: hypothetical protein COA77_10500 [Thaumarchaeota archaeon]|nr:MAG: hypothetical protein COA77_10500 [Nitrososphaerota archaeon]